MPENLPAHVGIIMDGNGRWAKARHMPRLAGHKQGVNRVDEVTERASKIGLQALTLFAFSNENWKRPEDEVTGLMGLLRWYLRAERKKIMNNNVRFRVIGDRRKLSTDIIELVEELELASSHHTGLRLSIALSYGSRSEIVRAASRIADDVSSGKIFSGDIDESLFESYLDTESLPPLDMVIRTSGEYRLSNFLLFQAAYAELFFEKMHWPDFSAERFVELLKEYSLRQRRFGKVAEQLEVKTFEPGRSAVNDCKLEQQIDREKKSKVEISRKEHAFQTQQILTLELLNQKGMKQLSQLSSFAENTEVN